MMRAVVNIENLIQSFHTNVLLAQIKISMRIMDAILHMHMLKSLLIIMIIRIRNYILMDINICKHVCQDYICISV